MSPGENGASAASRRLSVPAAQGKDASRHRAVRRVHATGSPVSRQRRDRGTPRLWRQNGSIRRRSGGVNTARRAVPAAWDAREPPTAGRRLARCAEQAPETGEERIVVGRAAGLEAGLMEAGPVGVEAGRQASRPEVAGEARGDEAPGLPGGGVGEPCAVRL
jgi:hypothetical protein